MAYTAKALVDIARAEIGYKEKKSNSQLDDPIANAGSNNWTKYARDLHNAGYYNGNKNGYSWCSVFVDWCFWTMCGHDKAAAERINCQTGKCGAVCTYSANYYKAQGRFSQEPKAGDQVYFKKSGSSGSSHTGIVEQVDDNYIYTIEGNASNCVKRNKYKRSYAYFYGFGHPKYDGDDEPDALSASQIVNAAVKNDTTKKVSASLYQLKNGSSGNSVKTLQNLLNLFNNAGLETDGSFGPATLEAVKNYQAHKGLTVDGVVGPATWAALINGES